MVKKNAAAGRFGNQVHSGHEAFFLGHAISRVVHCAAFYGTEA